MSNVRELLIEPMQAQDWPACRDIYLQGIATGLATFETDAPDWPAWDAAHLAEGRLVARLGDGQPIGWAALSPVSDRCAYKGVAELSIYVAEGARGQGVGRQLLDALLAAAEQAGYWTVQAGIIAENAASVALARAAGFRTVGRRERLGWLNGQWRDVLLLERRSARVGVDGEGPG